MNGTNKYLVIKAVAEQKKTKKRAAVELGLSPRQINRLVNAYAEKGKAAFVHGNKGKIPQHAIPKEIKETIVALYRAYEIAPNIVHFTEHLKEQHQLQYSDTTIRSVLSEALILSPKAQRKTRREMKKKINARTKKKEEDEFSNLPHASLEEPEKVHPSRPRKKYQGELIQMDASSYNWFGKGTTHLHLAIDDASGNIVGAYFDMEETLNGYYHVLHQILTKHGLPAAILTDKRTVFTYRQKNTHKLEEDSYTQFGFACHQLGITLSSTSIPQSKGRIERLNATVQSRLSVDLHQKNIQTIEEANAFLKRWVTAFNRKFGGKTAETVFEKSPVPSKLNLILARVATRKIDAGHHIKFQKNYYLPIKGVEKLYFTRNSEALVIEAFDRKIYINIDNQIYATEKLLDHERISSEFDEPMPQEKKERRQYIPPQSHPWKLASFNQYLRRIGKTLEEYEAEKTA